jgi:hypothetical protein
MTTEAPGPHYRPPDARVRRVPNRLRAPLAALAGVVVLIVGIAVLAAIGPDPRQGLVVIDERGGERSLCAARVEVSGEEPVDPGGASLVAPQWFVAERPTDQGVLSPNVPSGSSARITYVDEDGRPVEGGPWSGALIEIDGPDVPVERIEHRDDVC